MTNSKDYRCSTRYMLSRTFRSKGMIPLSICMKVYRRGDIVDVEGLGAVQKSMRHKIYQGRTGRIFNVTQHAVGVIVNNRVKGRTIPKKINVRVEHIKHSKSAGRGRCWQCRVEDLGPQLPRPDKARRLE